MTTYRHEAKNRLKSIIKLDMASVDDTEQDIWELKDEIASLEEDEEGLNFTEKQELEDKLGELDDKEKHLLELQKELKRDQRQYKRRYSSTGHSKKKLREMS